MHIPKGLRVYIYIYIYKYKYIHPRRLKVTYSATATQKQRLAAQHFAVEQEEIEAAKHRSLQLTCPKP